MTSLASLSLSTQPSPLISSRYRPAYTVGQLTPGGYLQHEKSNNQKQPRSGVDSCSFLLPFVRLPFSFCLDRFPLKINLLLSKSISPGRSRSPPDRSSAPFCTPLSRSTRVLCFLVPHIAPHTLCPPLSVAAFAARCPLSATLIPSSSSPASTAMFDIFPRALA